MGQGESRPKDALHAESLDYGVGNTYLPGIFEEEHDRVLLRRPSIQIREVHRGALALLSGNAFFFYRHDDGLTRDRPAGLVRSLPPTGCGDGAEAAGSEGASGSPRPQAGRLLPSQAHGLDSEQSLTVLFHLLERGTSPPPTYD